MNLVGSSETSVHYEDRQSVSVHLCWLFCLYTKLTKLEHTGRSVKNNSRSSSTRHLTSGLCHVSLASHSGGWGSIPGMSLWDLGSAEWHQERFLSQIFITSLIVSFYHWSILMLNGLNSWWCH